FASCSPASTQVTPGGSFAFSRRSRTSLANDSTSRPRTFPNEVVYAGSSRNGVESFTTADTQPINAFRVQRLDKSGNPVAGSQPMRRKDDPMALPPEGYLSSFRRQLSHRAGEALNLSRKTDPGVLALKPIQEIRPLSSLH